MKRSVFSILSIGLSIQFIKAAKIIIVTLLFTHSTNIY